MSDDPVTLKTCSVCRGTKPLPAFTVRTKNKDDHTSYCRACVNAANKRRYTQRPEQARARLRFAASRTRWRLSSTTATPGARRWLLQKW